MTSAPTSTGEPDDQEAGLPALFQNFARYNRAFNSALYDACETLDDEQRRRDLGAFFGSVQATLNHILLGDRLWLARFTGTTYAVPSLDAELYTDFAELRRERALTDDAVDAWVASLTPAVLSAPLRFHLVVAPGERYCPLWHAAQHFFNHQTHHRGQVTTLLAQLGVDVGVTDLMWLTGLLESVDSG